MSLLAFIVGYLVLCLAIVIPPLFIPLGVRAVVVCCSRRATGAAREAARLAVLDAAWWRKIERSLRAA